jgi:DNA-binding beta-propeller fold protein YncE
MGVHDGRLYVGDMDGVAVIDIAKGVVVETVKVEGAQQLNDVTIDKNGVVYVSDSKLGNVHAIKDGKATLWLEKLNGPNGLLAHGDDFYVLAGGAMHKVEKDKSLTKIVDGLQGGADGIEHVTGNEFIVSCWRGTIYYVDAAKREKQTLLDTSAQKVNSADIGYDAKNRIVYVPTFFVNTVVAYEVK